MARSYAQRRIDAEGEHRPNNSAAAKLNAAAELVSMRMSGRHTGSGPVTVEYNPKTDTSYWSRTLVKFIEERGEGSGVRVVRTGGK